MGRPDGPPVAPARRARVAVMLEYGRSLDAWKLTLEHGRARTQTPYGYGGAADLYDMEWSIDAEEGVFRRTLRRTIRRLVGADLVHVWRNRSLIRGADVVWTHTEKEHLAVALLLFFRQRNRRPKLLAQSVWLWDSWVGWGRLRRKLVASLLHVADVEIVHSEANRKYSAGQVPDRRVIKVPFGAAGPPSRPLNEDGYILALGNDPHRDWGLLMEVAKLAPHRSFVVASPNPSVRARAWPGNVEVLVPKDRWEVDRLYEGAAVVAVPLQENLHASGTTVSIEAASANRPLVAVDAGGLGEYVMALGGSLVVPSDADAFLRALEHPNTDLTSPADVGLSAENYVERYIWITELLLGNVRMDPRISAFRRTSWIWAAMDQGHPEATAPR